MRAYKILNHDFTCNEFQYEVGKTYEMPESDISLCNKGFHACHYMQRCFDYYAPNQRNKFVEVELYGKILGEKTDKFCASKIKIIRLFDFQEMIEIIKKQSIDDGNNRSDGNNCSNGNNRSNGNNYSDGNNCSNGNNYSDGNNYSNGNNFSNGNNYSNGNNCSNGIHNSFGIKKCNGIANELFNLNKKETYKIFNKKITKERFEKIKEKLYISLCGWLPKANNYHLLKEEISNNSEIPSDKIFGYEDLDWSGMPREAIDYIQSLPEFDKKMFFEISGIDVDKD